ncbi:hypothetical protein K505DRAFT_364699 [Melanomma pulvis-pyrius CBS 109.77]|uniref:Zn(2)-C6 fungal-type domain-containing protein n=1 Tax=Melanomma pulvis-pyrius CBS 109.77 TaxID=1314802 RepID=A0A6A6X298_9PLEO|nr:hypothetical protein K505DRAFT_364699 [Melanomma pulvis-pyrius CBS 109.77]
MGNDRSPTVSLNTRSSTGGPKLRKRTKTGCLTCRKRRIKCDERRPVCLNCVKSKRGCEGYNQRIIFKAPLGDWPYHPGVFSALQYHSSMLPGARNPLPQDGAWVDIIQPLQAPHCQLPVPSVTPRDYLQPLPNVVPSSLEVVHENNENSGRPYSFRRYDTDFSTTSSSTAIQLVDSPHIYSFDCGDVVEYLDDDYYDIESDEDSAICLKENSFAKYSNHANIFVSRGTLDYYRPQYTANPIKDPYMAHAFAYYVNVTGPSLSPFGLDHDGRCWTVSLPTLGLNNLGLLHSILALSTLQVAHVYGTSATPSMKHYAYSLKRLHRAIGHPKTRLQPSTLAAALLLASYELMVGDYVKWSAHLKGISTLLMEMEHILLLEMDSKLHKLYTDLFWSYAKQDTYHSILSGVDLSMRQSTWMKWGPREAIISPENPRGAFDRLLCILGRIAEYAADDRRRKSAFIKVNGGRWVPRATAKDVQHHRAVEDWSQIHSQLVGFINLLGPSFQPLGHASKSGPLSTFGPSLTYGTHASANLWVQIHMAHLVLQRSHPDLPNRTDAIMLSTSETRNHASLIGKIVAGLIPQEDTRPVSPVLQGILVEITMPLFIAAMQYQDHAARAWALEAFGTIGNCTGWKFAKEASSAVQHLWERASDMGRGPPWTKDECLRSELRNNTSSNSNLADLGEYWMVGEDYEALELLVSDGVSTVSERTTSPHLENKASPRTRNDNETDTEFEDEAYEGLVEFATPTLGQENAGAQRYEEQCRDSGICIEREPVEEHVIKIEGSWNADFITSTASTATNSVAGDAVEDAVERTEEAPSPQSDIASIEHSTSASDISVSTEESNEPSSLTTERRRVVDRVMSYFYTIFRVMPAANQRGHSETRTGSSQAAHGASIAQTNSTGELGSPSSRRLGKHPRQQGDDDHTDEEDNGTPKRPRKGKVRAEPDKTKRKFACPYFKRDPESFLARRSCVGPGWDEVRRVKEHLYRNHTLPIFCRRCYTIFKAETLLDDHQRAIEPCTMRPKEIIEGFDKLQHEKLRSRKKTRPEPNEEDKWRDVYRILFPSDDEASMPSPYLDVDWEKMYQKEKPSNELARYEQFLRRELPPAVRRELESAVEREFSPLEERLKSQLIEIVRDLQLQLFQSYTQTRRVATGTEMAPQSNSKTRLGTAAAEDTVSLVAHEAPLVVDSDPELVTLENQLAAYEPAPPLQDSPAHDFEAVLFQFDNLAEFEDSAYESMFVGSVFSKSEWDDGLGYCYDAENDHGEGPSVFE